MALPSPRITVVTQDEKDYFKLLGARVAQLRRDHGLTQAQLAEALGISQQRVGSYEVGRRRIPVSMLQSLAQALSMAVDELLGETAKARASALPKTQQKFVIQVLESVLAQQGR